MGNWHETAPVKAANTSLTSIITNDAKEATRDTLSESKQLELFKEISDSLKTIRQQNNIIIDEEI